MNLTLICLFLTKDDSILHKRRGIYVCFKSFELIAAGAFHPVFVLLPTMTRLKFKYRACYLVFYLVKKEQLISLTKLSFNKKIPSSDIYVGKIYGKILDFFSLLCSKQFAYIKNTIIISGSTLSGTIKKTR